MSPFAVIAICFFAAAQALVTPLPDDVINLCAATTCAVGSHCRVTQASADVAPTTSCVNCWPAGTDAFCNSHNYNYAILLGQAGNWAALSCADNSCPAGASCVVDAEGHGTCCYGEAAEGGVHEEHAC